MPASLLQLIAQGAVRGVVLEVPSVLYIYRLVCAKPPQAAAAGLATVVVCFFPLMYCCGRMATSLHKIVCDRPSRIAASGWIVSVANAGKRATVRSSLLI